MLARLTLMVSIAVVLMGRSQAAVVTSISATAPTGPDIVTSQTDYSGGLSWYNTGAGSIRDVGQSFLATSDYTLDKITLALGGSFGSVAATSDFTLTLYSAPSLSTSPASATVVSVQTGTFAFSTGSGGSGTFLTFDLADVALTAGTYYTLMFAFDDALANNSLTVRQNISSTYSNGYRWLFDGTSYTSSTGADLTFYVHAVPEPSTVMLVVAALVAGVLLRRRRTPLPVQP